MYDSLKPAHIRTESLEMATDDRLDVAARRGHQMTSRHGSACVSQRGQRVSCALRGRSWDHARVLCVVVRVTAHGRQRGRPQRHSLASFAQCCGFDGKVVFAPAMGGPAACGQTAPRLPLVTCGACSDLRHLSQRRRASYCRGRGICLLAGGKLACTSCARARRAGSRERIAGCADRIGHGPGRCGVRGGGGRRHWRGHVSFEPEIRGRL